jgi:signal transduction histidine kinase
LLTAVRPLLLAGSRRDAGNDPSHTRQIWYDYLSHGRRLIGLYDRVEAMGGTIIVDSPVGAGTAVLVSLPGLDLSAS